MRKRRFKNKMKLGFTHDRAKMLNDCFYHIFKSMQLCAWYVLYAPEFFDWEYDKLKQFSNRMDANNNTFGEESEDYKDAEKRLSEAIGFDFREESRRFPYRAKAKMYGKPIRGADITDIVEAMNLAAECSYFLTLYTLFFDFKLSVIDIKEIFIPQFLQITYEYSAGLTDEHLMKYFEELEGWEIEIEDKEAKIW